MQARRLPPRHGLLWLLAGFRLFRANPPLLTALTLGYLFLVVAPNLLPPIGPFLVPLALPALLVVLGNGCRAIERGGGTGAIALTYGIRQRGTELVRLGGLHLLGSILILAIGVIMEGDSVSLGGSGQAVDEQAVLAAMARLFIVALPVITAFWFAPLLTTWDGIAPLKAVFFSFISVWRNWQAFAVYGLSVAVVAIALPGLLLIMAGEIAKPLLDIFAVALKMMLVFVVAPTMMASLYVSYQDVFHSSDD
jgi:hypothetical protein